MNQKLTPKHLEVLAILASESEPIDYKKFLPDLNPILDLIEYKLVNKIDEGYKLSSRGEDYFNKLLQESSKYLENNINNSIN